MLKYFWLCESKLNPKLHILFFRECYFPNGWSRKYQQKDCKCPNQNHYIEVAQGAIIFMEQNAMGELRRCGCTCSSLCKIHSENCVRCAQVRLVFRYAMCDHNFAHLQNGQKMLFFELKTILEKDVLFCFRTP